MYSAVAYLTGGRVSAPPRDPEKNAPHSDLKDLKSGNRSSTSVQPWQTRRPASAGKTARRQGQVVEVNVA